MENHNYEVMLKTINEKLGFDIREYDKMDTRTECHECDNKPSPLEKLTIEELQFISENEKNGTKKAKLRNFYVKEKKRIKKINRNYGRTIC